MSDTSIVASSLPHRLERAVDWLAGRQRTLLLAGVGFQLFVLVGMIAFRAAPYWSGETVLLRVMPVDPRDMFRGDYVTLSYEFSRLPGGGVPGLGPRQYDRHDDRQGQTIYVSLVLEPDGKHWRAERFSIDRPTSGKYICGTIARWDRVEYGIESYFVQEGKGHYYEDAVRRRQLSAVVALSPDGRAALRGLQVDK
jgi:uncharacterized membrane-anchored protein